MKLTTMIIRTILLALIGGLLWLVLFGITGCQFFRKAERSSSDTASVKKAIDTGTKGDSSNTKKSSEYEKTTFIYPPSQPGDTTVINNYFPAMPRPTVVIQERGSAQEQTNTFNYEAWLRAMVDSAASSKKQSVVTTKASVLSPWHFIAIGGILLIALIVWLKLGKK